MNIVRNSRILADFITEKNLLLDVSKNNYTCDHIGALYTNVVLQAGLNYNNVVLPRVRWVRNKFPEANTLNGFVRIIDQYGFNEVIKWNHKTKIERIERLIEFAQEKKLQTISDHQNYFRTSESYEDFLKLNGFGPKSLDYLLNLLSFDTVAVDRHIFAFVSLAEIEVHDYQTTKKIVEYAADLINVSRKTLDKEIWLFMSKSDYKERIVHA